MIELLLANVCVEAVSSRVVMLVVAIKAKIVFEGFNALLTNSHT